MTKLTFTAKFQFQNGTITSLRQATKRVSNSLFQFQNGTITKPELRQINNVVLSFNSKMVRLKEGLPFRTTRRLEILFQFQNGTIKK